LLCQPIGYLSSYFLYDVVVGCIFIHFVLQKCTITGQSCHTLTDMYDSQNSTLHTCTCVQIHMHIFVLLFVFKFTGNWEIPFELISDLRWLGSGAQGAVFLGQLNAEPVAVKKVRNADETDILHLRKLSHPNIIKFKLVIFAFCWFFGINFF